MNKFIIALLLLVPTAANAEEITISQKDKAFDKTTIDAKIGDILVFKNDEKDITHNVYSLSSGNTFELKTQAPGEAAKIPLEAGSHQTGTMEVECAIHPNMRLTVNIK